MPEMFAIYRPGAVHPGYYRVRRWLVTEGAAPQRSLAGLGSTLEAARQVLPSGLARRDRLAGDAPNIIEVWS